MRVSVDKYELRKPCFSSVDFATCFSLMSVACFISVAVRALCVCQALWPRVLVVQTPAVFIFLFIMHYMRGPCSNRTLAPPLTILDCEFRDWVVDFCFRAHVAHEVPSEIAAERSNQLLMHMMGRCGRQLWLEGHDRHDTMTFFATPHEEIEPFLADFLQTFKMPFWDAIPPGKDPNLDRRQKGARMGNSMSEDSSELS